MCMVYAPAHMHAKATRSHRSSAILCLVSGDSISLPQQFPSSGRPDDQQASVAHQSLPPCPGVRGTCGND